MHKPTRIPYGIVRCTSHTDRSTCSGGFQCNKAGDTSSAGRTPWEAVVHADSNRRKHPKAGGKDCWPRGSQREGGDTMGKMARKAAESGFSWLLKWRFERYCNFDSWSNLNGAKACTSDRCTTWKGRGPHLLKGKLILYMCASPKVIKSGKIAQYYIIAVAQWLDGDGMTNRLKFCCVI